MTTTTTTTTTECCFHGCHQPAIESPGFCREHSCRGVTGTCDKTPAMPDSQPDPRAVAIRYLDRVMPLCLAVACLVGCSSNATGLDTPDASPAVVVPVPQPDATPAPTPQPDASPAPGPEVQPSVTPDAEPAPAPDTRPAATPDVQPAPPAPDTRPAVDTRPPVTCNAGDYPVLVSTSDAGTRTYQCTSCTVDKAPDIKEPDDESVIDCTTFVAQGWCPQQAYQAYCAASCGRCNSENGN
jgi:hypothetical protein